MKRPIHDEDENRRRDPAQASLVWQVANQPGEWIRQVQGTDSLY